MSEINKHEIRSPEMQEVMSGIPGRFLKWGLFLFFAMLIVIIGVTWFIYYPDIVTAPVTITTYNYPVPLVAKSGGKIEKLIVDNGDRISLNQPVAIIESTARYEDVELLAAFLDTLGNGPCWQQKVMKYDPPANLSLGDIQSSYSHFAILFLQLKEYIRQAYLISKLILLKAQIVKQEEYIEELQNQEKLSEVELDLVRRSFERDSLLYSGNLHSLTVSEYEKSKQALIQKQSSYGSLKAYVKKNESSALKMKESVLDLHVQLKNELNQYELDMDDSFKMLCLAIDKWKEKYLFQSPVTGEITFARYSNSNQVIKAGEILATVTPEDTSKIIVRANVPISGLGRVKVGQAVNIKLSGFHYMEFGVLKGRIKTISRIPLEEPILLKLI
jgi:multidrug efflux pump subunit AcrA (membrane-fusion protein)